MSDAELLRTLLDCQIMRKQIASPNAKEIEADKYLRWAVEDVAHRIWWDNRKQK
jgi:pyocin large subunit-like protein